MNLVEAFSEIEDFRRPQGRRYPLAPMLIIIIMSIACGYSAYREIEHFAKADIEILSGLFCLRQKKMPSHVTIRTLIQNSDFGQIRRIFDNRSRQYVSIEAGDWLPIDGKAIASTVSNYDNSYQDFVSLVSIFPRNEARS